MLDSACSVKKTAGSFISVLRKVVLGKIEPVIMIPSEGNVCRALRSVSIRMVISYFGSGACPQFGIFFGSLFLAMPGLVTQHIIG